MLKVIHTDNGFAVFDEERKIATVHVDEPDPNTWGIALARPCMTVRELQSIIDALRTPKN